jgi:uncharacterized protein (TIGR03437 family)
VKQPSYRKTIYALAAFCALAPLGVRAQVQQYTIWTIAGTGTNGYAGDAGPALQANFSNPCKLAIDPSGNIYIADLSNNRIRKISGANINTIAGNGTAGYTGDGKPATQANISQPCGVAVDASGNVYFSQTDATNSAVRKAPASGNISTVTGTSVGAGFGGDGGPATSGRVAGPQALALDGAGNLYIADTLNNRIRQVTTGSNIYTVVGSGVAQFSGDQGSPINASINGPQGIAFDSAGAMYIADTGNHRIRKVSAGVITTIAGTGVAGFSGDGGPAVNAQLNYPKDVAVDAAGDVFIVDSYNFRIRMITPDGNIQTIAGSGRSGYSGDGGPAKSGRLSFPQGIVVASNGSIYISDTQNNVIRWLAPNGTTFVTPPTINSVVSASGCGGYTSMAPGAWIEVHGSSLAADTRTWAASDFNGDNAPTALDGTQVSIAGQNAVVLYISATQVNAQVPLNVSPGQQQITVTAPNGPSVPFTITVNAAQPGLCQGAQVGNNLYAAGVVNNTSTYVLPASANVAGVTFRPAHPGEIISFFGNGFGAVIPSPDQGQLVRQTNQLATPLQVFFGQTQATVQYAGLAPGFLGLYQFNVIVPNIPDSDAVPVTFALGNFAGAPTLYTAVRQQ